MVNVPNCITFVRKTRFTYRRKNSNSHSHSNTNSQDCIHKITLYHHHRRHYHFLSSPPAFQQMRLYPFIISSITSSLFQAPSSFPSQLLCHHNQLVPNTFTTHRVQTKPHNCLFSTSSFNSSPQSSSFESNQNENYSQRQESSTTTSTSSSPNKMAHSYRLPNLANTPKDEKQRLMNSLIPTHDEDNVPYSLYDQLVSKLYLTNMFNPVKLDLENMNKLHTILGNPMDKPDRMVIHIAGTNGKGSVTTKIAKTLELAGYKVGLFTSPHISSFRERIQINSTPISSQHVEQYLLHIFQLCENHDIPATFFEITTALAFHYFDQQDVDVVVLETGLGGRLDATNVIANPALCVITSIGLEHTAILGNTVELIAAEKAGIIKKNVPILVGPNAPHDVIRDIAVKKGAEGFYLCPSVAKDCDDDGIMGFIDYDVENSMISTTAIEILQQKGSFEKIASKRQNVKPISLDIINEGISVRPTCRFELYEYQLPTDHGNKSVQVIFDVAHNPQAMKLLQAKLLNLFPTTRTNSKKGSSLSSQNQKTYSYRFIVGFSSDKDLASCSQTLLSLVNNDPTKIHLVQASNPRAASLRDILASEPKLNQAYYNNNDVSINYQVQHALELITKNRNKKLSPNSEETEKDQNEEEIIIVCGSVFLMSEARESFGIDEPRDSKYIAQIVGSGYKSGQENFGNNALRNNK